MIRTALTAFTMLTFTAPALAHDGDKGRDDAPAAVAQATVSQEDALGIAQSRGVITVREIKLDEGNWEIEGFNKEGRKIEVEVSAATGDVVKVETY